MKKESNEQLKELLGKLTRLSLKILNDLDISYEMGENADKERLLPYLMAIKEIKDLVKIHAKVQDQIFGEFEIEGEIDLEQEVKKLWEEGL